VTAFSFPDSRDAKAWWDSSVAQWRAGGNLTFHTPTGDGRLFVTMFGQDSVRDVELAARPDALTRGIIRFEAVFPSVVGDSLS
jgi:hypothetical protein